MHKLFNAFLVLTVLVSGFLLYSMEHETRGLERQIAKYERSMAVDREDMKLLSAEWSSLTRPDRIEQLAEQHLKLQTMQAIQIVPMTEVASKVPAEPVIKLEAQDKDPIGDILQKMQ
ncbi:cell division protein FtsL [Aestuariivirga sp.]|uniref:cell division protein FtsL n=1 Tax=Aestuariivirga sp. TaxID=2650926 RepID=UPI0039E2826B